MADYPIISDVGSYVLRRLRERMCPEPVPSPNNIELSSPADQDVDYILGVYLYDIREEGEISTPPMMQSGSLRLRKVPRPYSLHYMIFINGSSQMGLKAPDIQKIIGRAAQVINDNNSVSPISLQPWLEVNEPVITLSANKLPLEEKVRVWQAINKPYQVSLFYKASPVFISSEIILDVPRVTSADFEIRRMGGGRRDG